MEKVELRFILEPRVDFKTAWQFYQKPVFGGENLWQQRAILLHDRLKNLKNQPQPKKFLQTYINSLYWQHSSDFLRRLTEIEKLYRHK